METPNYIKALVKPNGKGKANARRVWSIDLETVWLPFFMATNTAGDTAIPNEALGAPLRLATNPDGAVRFSKQGRPVIKVAKDISDNIRLVRENFVSGLQSYATKVATDSHDAYIAQCLKAKEAGKPLIDHDSVMLDKAIAKMQAEAIAEAEVVAEAEAVVAEASKAEPGKSGKSGKGKKPELVTA